MEARRIFVVDDEPAVLTVLGRMLHASGYEVSTFSSPSAFLEAAPQEGVGCVLMDLSMPEMSGIEVQDAMHRKGITMPVIFLSAYGDVPSTARAMREGALDFLEKPVQEAQLLSAIQRAMERATVDERRRISRSDVEERLSRLTPRERQDRQGASRPGDAQARSAFRRRAGPHAGGSAGRVEEPIVL
jgi:FixJ family two-component response regulator